MTNISLFWSDVSERLSVWLRALVQEEEFRFASEDTADICIYGQVLHRFSPAVNTIVIRELADLSQMSDECDFLLPVNSSAAVARQILKQAVCRLQLTLQNHQLAEKLMHEQEQFQRLMEIGLALSAEQNHHKLLKQILTEARHFGQCDAASIFLIDRTGKEDRLVFKLTQNDSLEVDFKEQHFPLNASSLAGHAALSGEILNFEDVYKLPEKDNFNFNRFFDQKTGYRTRSMLVIPMRSHEGRIVGVIQFINRKRQNVRLTSVKQTEELTLPFDNRLEGLLKAMASQAAVAIENNLLLERINTLFEGFVHASVRAIEQRDPTTSGHSFRVAELTTSLAEAAMLDQSPALRPMSFSVNELRELRYAALLHDFGKVGVREHVLIKAKKLTPIEYTRFQYRIALQREALKNRFMRQRLQLAKEGRLSSQQEERIGLEEMAALAELENMRLTVEQANEPSVLDDESSRQLLAIRKIVITDIDGLQKPLLPESEFLALAVKKGSLTESERREIESHVNHTINFLETIPWTPELEGIPKIAGAHHEKLDGSGYPNSLKAEEIPVGAKMMTICDIFDALTASDRPYKPALTLSQALDILGYEAREGKIDSDLYSLFCKLPHRTILSSLKTPDT